MFVSNFDSWHNLYFCLNWVEFRSTVYPVVAVGSLTHDLAITVMRRRERERERERTWTKIIMQEKLFQRCTHLVYCSVLSLGGNVNTRRMSKPDMGSIVHIKNQWNILGIGNYYVNYQNHQNLMLLTFSDTKRTPMYLFLFTNSSTERTGFNMYAVYTQMQ